MLDFLNIQSRLADISIVFRKFELVELQNVHSSPENEHKNEFLEFWCNFTVWCFIACIFWCSGNERRERIESVYQIVVYFSHVSYPGIELTPLL